MVRKSAGILLYRRAEEEWQFFLVHPGGPYWKDRDAGAWTIPKGEFTEAEEPLAAAVREFAEETGTQLAGDFIPLQPVRQKAGKWVYAWALAGDLDADNIQSNTYRQEWPYKSGRWQPFPEVDAAGWFNLEAARQKINPAQFAFIEELMGKL